jgi:hydrogenase nickel incorporation protein HypA/HybF
MHEMSVATSLIEEILSNLKDLKVNKVEAVTLVIGELAFISETQLEFCYDLLKKEHEVLKGSTLVMEKEEAEVECQECGYSGGLGTVDEPVDHRMMMSFMCPKCGGTFDILKGRGMILKKIQAEVEE